MTLYYHSAAITHKNNICVPLDKASVTLKYIKAGIYRCGDDKRSMKVVELVF